MAGSFTRPTLPQIIARVQADLNGRLPGADSMLRRSVLGILARVWAGAIHLLYGFISYLADQFLPDTAEKAFLLRIASIWNVPGNPAAGATGPIQFTGTEGRPLPALSALKRSDGWQYVTTADATVIGGVLNVTVAAATGWEGVAGDTDTGTTLTLIGAVSGISAAGIVQSPGLSGGTDAELDPALRSRVIARIQSPPKGGSNDDYVKWAKEVPGVTRVWVYPLQLGVGTVMVAFVRDGDTSIIPDSGEVATVQAHIDAARPVTANVTVFAPTAVPKNLTIALSPDTSATRAAVLAELADFFGREAIPNGTLKWSRLDDAISQADGEFSHVLSIPTGDITTSFGQMATLGTVTWA